MDDEFIINHVVQIVDEKGKLKGTGFFVRKGYCITAHHVIYKLNSIKINHNGERHNAEWKKEYSDPIKDIAILYVKDWGDDYLVLGGDIYRSLPIEGYGFRGVLQFGDWFKGEIGDLILYSAPEGENVGENEWNKRPFTSVRCYKVQFEEELESGLSGSPIIVNRKKVIVMSISLLKYDRHRGYIIPIDVINKYVDKSESKENGKCTEIYIRHCDFIRKR